MWKEEFWPANHSAGVGNERMSETLTPLCEVAALKEDEGIQVELSGRPAVAVFLHEGEIYVTDDLCTHGPASLSDGLCIDGQIECPFHLGRFSLATGAVTYPPCTEPIAVHGHRVVDGMVYLVEG